MNDKKLYWSDFHTNMHDNHIDNFDWWQEFAEEMLDFWAPVYYPYHVVESETGFHYEDTLSEEQYKKTWAIVNKKCQKSEDFIIYPSYEWQGNGQDGDHNVFFPHFNGKIEMPLTYKELVDIQKCDNAIGIPHHPGYQPGHRGKNWETHNEEFSPVVEIYSSHGSSESSESNVPLNVHVHMGPRGERGTIMYALRQNKKVGIIASGDNHICPAISGNGFFGVYAEVYSHEGIIESIKKRNTFGVSRSKMNLFYGIDNYMLGDQMMFQDQHKLDYKICGTSDIEKIEIIKDGTIADVRYFTPIVNLPKNGEVMFKFELELGWGPDRRVFPDIQEKEWDVNVKTKGEIYSIEKLWTYPGSKIKQINKSEVKGKITTRKDIPGNSKLSQKNYLTPHIQNQSIILEIRDDINNDVEFSIDGEHFTIPIRTILTERTLRAQEKQAAQLITERFNFKEYYREDPWWHNAYKILIHKGSLEESYKIEDSYICKDMQNVNNIMLKVTQRNGDTAWGSPIFNKK